jgi:hypothetical protein
MGYPMKTPVSPQQTHHDPWPNCLALDHRGAVVPSIADDLLQGLMTCAYYKYQKDAGLSSK